MDKASESKKSFVTEFVDFLQTFGVRGLAIAFIIWAAASTLVSALVSDLVNPHRTRLPSANLASLHDTLTAPVSQKPTVFLYGDFVSKIINFTIIALVVFAMYKQLKKMGLAKL